MIRCTEPGASCVWRVPKTRCPVSAAVRAVAMVSRSRNSPTRMTSGSWRRACLRALAKLRVSVPTSRWFTTAVLWRCRNSIGSSTVITCTARVRLMRSMIAASVVDLPCPVAPVTSTRPRVMRANSPTIGGMPSSSSDRMSSGMARSTAPTEPRW